MSARGARAQARARRVATTPTQAQPQPPQPNIGAAGGINVKLTNIQEYREASLFTDLLQRIGVTQACIDQLTNDDFDTMELYFNSTKEMSLHLKCTSKQ